MKSYFAFFLMSIPAWGADFNMTPVGDDGGFRMTGPCSLLGASDDCPIDTGAPFSVVGLSDQNKDLPSLAKREVGSVGLSMECDLVNIPDFQLFNLSLPNQQFWRCPNLPSVSTLIGMNFFEASPFLLDFFSQSIDFAPVRPDRTHDLSLWASDNKLLVGGNLGDNSMLMAVDTGTPVTLVDQSIVDAHPEIFEESSRPATEMMKRRGLRRFEMHEPFVVDGVPLQAEYVYGANLTGVSHSLYEIILGLNHLKNASWYFDVPNKKWAISPAR